MIFNKIKKITSCILRKTFTIKSIASLDNKIIWNILRQRKIIFYNGIGKKWRISKIFRIQKNYSIKRGVIFYC